MLLKFKKFFISIFIAFCLMIQNLFAQVPLQITIPCFPAQQMLQSLKDDKYTPLMQVEGKDTTYLLFLDRKDNETLGFALSPDKKVMCLLFGGEAVILLGNKMPKSVGEI